MKHIFRLFPIFEQIQALRNQQAALKAKRDGGLDALMDSIYQDVSFETDQQNKKTID